MSLLQELAKAYDKSTEEYGVDTRKLIDQFMREKYPNGFPDFSGDIHYSKKHWDEMEKWAKEKGIDMRKNAFERGLQKGFGGK